MPSIYTHLIPTESDRKSKDSRNRILQVVNWCIKHNIALDEINLEIYMDYLRAEGLSPSSIKAHLSTIRAWLKRHINEGKLAEVLLQQMDDSLPIDEKQAQITAAINKVRQAIDPQATPVTLYIAEARNQNLTDTQVNQLFDQIKPNSLTGLRDLGIIGLLAGMGLREAEVCALQVSDLDHKLEGKLALHVPQGRGCTERVIPYAEDTTWVSRVVGIWQLVTGIEEGPIFRGIHKSGNLLRKGPLSVSAVERLLANYPIVIDGNPIVLKPLDLRHAYATHLYRSRKVKFDDLKGYLGVKTNKTIFDYLGREVRGEGSLYADFHYDLSRFNN